MQMILEMLLEHKHERGKETQTMTFMNRQIIRQKMISC